MAPPTTDDDEKTSDGGGDAGDGGGEKPTGEVMQDNPLSSRFRRPRMPGQDGAASSWIIKKNNP